MIDLFLVEPTFNDEQDVGSAKLRISLLSKLESVLWKLLTSGGRSEVRLWLSNTIASVTSISPQHQRDLFMALLRRKPLKRAFASQLLQMLFEKRSREAGILIAKRSYIMENFFEGDCSVYSLSNLAIAIPADSKNTQPNLHSFKLI